MITHPPSPTRLRALAAAALVLASLAACSSGGARPSVSGEGTSPAVASPSAGASGAPSGSPATDSGVSGPTDPTAVPGAPGVPEIALRAAIADAASRAGVDAAQVTVVSGEPRTWPDGSLGCPKMGFMYTQVVTPGYRLVLEAGGHQYDYRGSLRGGDPALCENPVPGAGGGQG